MKQFLTGVSLIFMGSIAVPVQAQSSDPSPVKSSDETMDGRAALSSDDIVVTAQRRGERLQSVPISVSVVSGDALQAQNLSGLEGISARMPAVVIRPAPGGDQLHIRGAGSGFNPGFEQSVATFVDNIYRPRARSSRIAVFDIERVEILKGPQTTYFGANAIAGALNITTRKPGREPGMNFLAFYSPSLNERNIEAGADLPVSDDLAFRFAARSHGMDSPTWNTLLNGRGEQKTNQLRASVVYEPSDSFSATGRFDYAQIDNQGMSAVEALQCPPEDLPAAGQCLRSINVLGKVEDKLDRRNASGFFDISTTDLYEGAIELKWDFGGAQLISTSSYQKSDAAIVFENVPLPVLSPLGVNSLVVTDQLERYEQISQEIRLQSDNDGPLQYMLGGYFDRGTLRVGTRLGYFQAALGALATPDFSATDLIVSAADAYQKSRTLSAFGTLTYQLSPVFEVTAGLRYSNIRKSAERDPYVGRAVMFNPSTTPAIVVERGNAAGQAALAPTVGAVLSDFADGRRVDDAWMPSVNFRYKPSNNFMAYLSYTKGFKAGGYNLMLAADTFGPERVQSFEGGIKATWLDGRITTNLTLFQADYDDLQVAGNVFTSGGGLVAFIGNAAESRSRGAEFFGRVDLGGGLSLHTDLAYLDAKYTSYRNAPCSALQNYYASQDDYTCPQDLSGARRDDAPKFSGSVGFNLDLPINDDLEFSLAGTSHFRTDYYLQSIPEAVTEQKGYAKFDLRAALASTKDQWEIALIGQNLTNKMTASLYGHLPTSLGSILGIAERGRFVGVQFSVSIGK
ncbi:MAG: TonB-dependent receptor [Alphaproteobacteria bacterium HGW-Alphaproteobacteria-13]|jgi:outer membrane receptor protein involved in Fe transport|nr:MAG: TonB-dependent receptor [Alphaproteobacteria bacterium HGW-Alphaproteobacteria-13]